MINRNLPVPVYMHFKSHSKSHFCSDLPILFSSVPFSYSSSICLIKSSKALSEYRPFLETGLSQNPICFDPNSIPFFSGDVHSSLPPPLTTHLIATSTSSLFSFKISLHFNIFYKLSKR